VENSNIILKSFIKKLFFGTNIPQEYLCIDENAIVEPLKVIFSSNGLKIDVTDEYLFIGYKPVIIGITFDKSFKPENLQNPVLSFVGGDEKKSIAQIQLLLGSKKEIAGKTFVIFTATKGTHKFINPLQKQLILLHQKLQKKKLGNVNLPGNLYEQVEIAYSLPRKICLITLGDSGMFNMFPTDLHGKIDEDNYVISLRSDGKANAQVNKFRKITLSNMNLNRYKYVYSLGKNHMQDLKGSEFFELTESLSETYSLPLPAGCVEYLELELKESFPVGIHNLNHFRITNKKTISNNDPVLSHIHRSYLSSLLKKGYKIDYKMR